MAVLEKEIQDQIDKLIDDAYLDFQNEKYEESYNKNVKAWDLFPLPKTQWNEAYNTAKYIFNDMIILKKYDLAKQWLNEMIAQNNNLHLMDFDLSFNIGKYHFETSDFEKAKEEWDLLVKQQGLRYFGSEDPRYLEFYKNSDKILAESKENFTPKTTTQELTDETCDQIEELSEQGNEYFDDENYNDAIKIWKQTLALIPNPQNVYAESQWLETSIGDAYFLTEEFAQALEHFQNAKNNIEANAYENPFIMLRLGQSLLENNQPNEAKEYLLRAYMFEGEEIFENDDAKYFEFLKQNVELE